MSDSDCQIVAEIIRISSEESEAAGEMDTCDEEFWRIHNAVGTGDTPTPEASSEEDKWSDEDDPEPPRNPAPPSSGTDEDLPLLPRMEPDYGPTCPRRHFCRRCGLVHLPGVQCVHWEDDSDA